MHCFFCTRYLEEYESIYQEASADVTKYLANPINAYLLVKRLTADWKQVEGVMTQNVGPGVFLHYFYFLFFPFLIATVFAQPLFTISPSTVVCYVSRLMRT